MAKIKRQLTPWESINKSLLEILQQTKYTKYNKDGIQLSYFGSIKQIEKIAIKIQNACERSRENE